MKQPDRQTTSFVIILDTEASMYLAQVASSQVNQYLVDLLRAEKQRRAMQTISEEGLVNRLYDTISNTPDTSGYPQMTKHFETPD